MLTYLNVEPRYDDKEMANVSSVAPSLVGLSPQNAKTKASGYTVKVVGDGTKVVSQTPAAGQQMRSGGVIVGIYRSFVAKGSCHRSESLQYVNQRSQ